MAKSQNKPAVVVVGSCMIDFVSYTPHFAREGETVVGRRFVTNFGGKGANQCVAAAKLGAESAMVARLGDDVWGQRYIDNLQRENVRVEYVKRAPNSETGIAQISVSDQGHSRIVVIPGANEELNVQDVEDATSVISSAAVLVLQLETSEEVAIKAMNICKGKSILNAAPAITDFNPDILKLPSIFVVNETEAETFSGLPVTTVEEAHDAAAKLISLGCQSVIVTLGQHGAVYHTRNERFRFRCPEVECVDSTGAGDAFIGALAYLVSYKSDLPMKDAIELSCKIASDSVTRPGTQASFPDKDILRKFKIK